jgi:hypothetical protein
MEIANRLDNVKERIHDKILMTNTANKTNAGEAQVLLAGLKKYDTAENGFLTHDNFKTALGPKNMNAGIPESDLNLLLLKFDPTNTGIVEYNTFLKEFTQKSFDDCYNPLYTAQDRVMNQLKKITGAQPVCEKIGTQTFINMVPAKGAHKLWPKKLHHQPSWEMDEASSPYGASKSGRISLRQLEVQNQQRNVPKIHEYATHDWTDMERDSPLYINESDRFKTTNALSKQTSAAEKRAVEKRARITARGARMQQNEERLLRSIQIDRENAENAEKRRQMGRSAQQLRYFTAVANDNDYAVQKAHSTKGGLGMGGRSNIRPAPFATSI